MKPESQPDQDPDQSAKDAVPRPGQMEQGFYTDGAGWMWAIIILATILWVAFLLWCLL